MKIRLRGPLSRPAAAGSCFDPGSLSSDGGDQTTRQLIKELRAALRKSDECLEKKFNENYDVNQLVKARAWVVDQLIIHAWHKLIPTDQDVSLVAVGGFGRGDVERRPVVLDNRNVL